MSFQTRTEGLPKNTLLPLRSSSIYTTILFYQHLFGMVEESVKKERLTPKPADTPAERQVCAPAAVLPAS